jgi:hypothetical protein
MLNGGVNEGDEPGAEAAQWMMNAIQYEYGFILSRDLSRTGLVVLGEYSRRSSHPLRSGFEDPAADVLRLGVGTQVRDSCRIWRAHRELGPFASPGPSCTTSGVLTKFPIRERG